jgi:hypothetical protein
MNRKTFHSAGVFLVAAMATLSLAACNGWGSGNAAELASVATKINKTLPKKYVDELVMEHAHVDGNRLVVDIRIPDASIKQLKQDKIPLIQRQEQGDLNLQVCADPDLASLIKHKSQVARRFLDRDGKTIFEIVATVPDCDHG